MDLKEIGWKVVDLIHLAKDGDQEEGLVNMVINLRFALKDWNFLII
jgi:hypothetical protein